MRSFAVFIMFTIWLMHTFSAGVAFYCFPRLGYRFLTLVLPLLLTGIFVAVFMAGRAKDNAFLELLSYYWLGGLFIIFSAAAAVFLVSLAVRAFGADARFWTGLTGFSLAFIGIVAAIIGGLRAPSVTEVKVKAANLNRAALKIVQVSDTHLGPGISIKRTQKLVDRINALSPDLVLFSGDIHEGSGVDGYAEVLSQITAPKFGSMGNHEFYRGAVRGEEFYAAAGIKSLRQQCQDVFPGITACGVDDITAGRVTKERLEEFLSTLNVQNFNIIMSHEPVMYDVFAARGAGLVLSGHTHNGQIFPFNLLVKLRYKYNHGLYQIKNSSFYVTSGTFFWGPPMRLFTKNELPVITVER